MKPKRSKVVMRDDRKQILDIREHLDLAVPAVNSSWTFRRLCRNQLVMNLFITEKRASR